jgi:hypothetical protein
MGLIQQAIKNEENIKDWSEEGDLGQAINELIAIVSNASAYREGRHQFLKNLEVGA